MARTAPAAARLLWILASVLALLLFLPPAGAAESGIFCTSGHLSREAAGEQPGLYLNANFSINLPTIAEETLKRGVALYFVSEFELKKKRWYWADREIASDTHSARLSYSLLTRKYHLGGGGLSLSFGSLPEALSILGSIRQWKVAEPRAIAGSFQDYSARVRLRLDRSRLPRPLQLGANDWDLTSDWVSIPISPAVVSP